MINAEINVSKSARSQFRQYVFDVDTDQLVLDGNDLEFSPTQIYISLRTDEPEWRRVLAWDREVTGDTAVLRGVTWSTSSPIASDLPWDQVSLWVKDLVEDFVETEKDWRVQPWTYQS